MRLANTPPAPIIRPRPRTSVAASSDGTWKLPGSGSSAIKTLPFSDSTTCSVRWPVSRKSAISARTAVCAQPLDDISRSPWPSVALELGLAASSGIPFAWASRRCWRLASVARAVASSLATSAAAISGVTAGSPDSGAAAWLAGSGATAGKGSGAPNNFASSSARISSSSASIALERSRARSSISSGVRGITSGVGLASGWASARLADFSRSCLIFCRSCRRLAVLAMSVARRLDATSEACSRSSG